MSAAGDECGECDNDATWSYPMLLALAPWHNAVAPNAPSTVEGISDEDGSERASLAIVVPIKRVRVFSATMARDREILGDRVMAWIREHPGVEVLDTVVMLSSDRKFHCLTIVLFCGERQ